MARDAQLQNYAWVAGFFDGEGTTLLKEKKRPRISIGQKYPEPLLKVQGIMQFGTLIQASNGPYYYRVNRFDHVQQFLANVWPWLTEIKKEQASLVMRKFLHA